MEGFGKPIGSHLVPTDAGYVDLTGVIPVRPGEGQGAAEGGRRGDAAQRHADAAAAAVRAQGRRGRRRAAGQGRRRRQDRERRVGAVARRARSRATSTSRSSATSSRSTSMQLRQPELLLRLRLQGLPRPARQAYARPTDPKERTEAVRRHAAPCSPPTSVNAYLFQLPQFAVANKRLKGLWTSSPIFANDLGRAVAGSERAVGPMTALHELARDRARSRCYRAARALAGRGDAGGARAHRSAGSRTCSDLCARPRRARSPRRAPREARWLRRRAAVGPLDGVPATIKENIATARHAGAAGHRGDRCWRRRRTTRRRRRACARPARCILGKTTMPDYGMLSSGLSSFHALTRNPWDLSKNPGGCSAGAGAGGRGRLRAAARRHRHRRLDPPAGRLVRRLRPEAEPRPRSRSTRRTPAASPGR